MVFICIYLGLIQSLKLEGVNFVLQVTQKQGKSIGGTISPDLELFQANKKTPELPLLTNTSKRLNLFLLIPEERKKVNS